LAKGAGNIWYAGNSPGQAVSIFFSDGQGGTFYKSVPVGGVPTDVSVSPDGDWLAVIFTASDGSGGRISVFSIDGKGDLSLAATSDPIGIASFNGVAFSQ
jgi:DNA-binding beta-propeller fold protein YncE